MDRRVTPPKRITSPTWGPPPPCKQAFKLVDVWTVVTIDYVTWKIVPKLDYLNKEGILITV